MRTSASRGLARGLRFLSIQAQDFIEDEVDSAAMSVVFLFLSIQAQDFIEENRQRVDFVIKRFLSIQAQDFIEDPENAIPNLEGGVNS